MDQSLLSIIDETKPEIDSAVTIEKMNDVFKDAINKALSNGSQYANKFVDILNKLGLRVTTIFKDDQNKLNKPQVISMVREAFDLGPFPDFQNFPVGNTGESNEDMESQVKDNRELTKNEEPPKVEEVATDPATELVGHMDNIHTVLYQTKNKLDDAYKNALELKGDSELKLSIIRQTDKLRSKLDNLMDLADNIHRTVRMIK